MKQSFLATVSFFSGFPEAELERIASLMMERHYRRGAVIFLEGDVGEELFLVTSGTVQVCRFDAGKKIILDTFQKGHIFGEMSVFDEGQVRSATAESFEKTSLYVLKRRELKQFLEGNPALMMTIVNVLIERLRKADELIHDITFLDVRSRIYKQILRLSKQYGVSKESGVLIDLRLTHQLIADMVGCTREMVSKVLSELQAEHLISLHKKQLTLKNPSVLEHKLQYA